MDEDESAAFITCLTIEDNCKLYRDYLKNLVRNNLKEKARDIYEEYIEPPHFKQAHRYGWDVLSKEIKNKNSTLQQKNNYAFLQKIFKKIDAIEEVTATLKSYPLIINESQTIQNRLLDEKGNLTEFTYQHKIKLFGESLKNHSKTLTQRRESWETYILKIFITILLIPTAIGIFFIPTLWEIKGERLLKTLDGILSTYSNTH